MVINHLEKLFVTNDASTIMSELEVEHPAAKLLVLAAQAQQQEIGDATNFVRMPGKSSFFHAICCTRVWYIFLYHGTATFKLHTAVRHAQHQSTSCTPLLT